MFGTDSLEPPQNRNICSEPNTILARICWEPDAFGQDLFGPQDVWIRSPPQAKTKNKNICVLSLKISGQDLLGPKTFEHDLFVPYVLDKIFWSPKSISMIFLIPKNSKLDLLGPQNFWTGLVGIQNKSDKICLEPPKHLSICFRAQQFLGRMFWDPKTFGQVF